MTGSLRSTARNPVAVALMGVLILVFLILGVGGGGRFPDMLRGARPDAVVTAGGHAVNTRDFRRIFEQQKDRLEQQAGQTFTPQFLIENGFDQALLNQIAMDQGLAELLTRSGIVPSVKLVDDQIRKLPFAFDRVTGKFSERQFTQFLAQQGMTPKEALEELTDELAQRHLVSAIDAGFRVPATYGAISAALALEARDVSYFLLPISAVPPPPPPTDDQLLAFMKQHAAQITRPEMRVLTVVRISAKDFAPSVKIDDAAIQKAFDARKESLSTPEKRTIIQMPLKNAAQAGAVQAALAGSTDPAALQKATGIQPLVYADQPQTAVADRKIAAAAFAMAPGAPPAVVQGDLDSAVIRVVKVTPGTTATLASARAKIEADLRDKAAADKAYEVSQKYDDARQRGAGVAEAAKGTGVAAITLGPVTDKGQDAQGKPNPLLTDRILKSAFMAAAGEETDLEDAGQGEYYALKVEKVLPPALPPLNEVRPEITRAWQGQQIAQALKAKADSLSAAIRGGEAIDKAAASAGATVVRQAGMRRLQVERFKDLGRDFLGGVFAAKSGEVFAAPAANGVYVAKLDAVHPADPAEGARFVQALQGRLAEAYLNDLSTAIRTAARNEERAQINLNLARQAVGVDPATLAKTKGKKGAAAK